MASVRYKSSLFQEAQSQANKLLQDGMMGGKLGKNAVLILRMGKKAIDLQPTNAMDIAQGALLLAYAYQDKQNAKIPAPPAKMYPSATYQQIVKAAELKDPLYLQDDYIVAITTIAQSIKDKKLASPLPSISSVVPELPRTESQLRK